MECEAERGPNSRPKFSGKHSGSSILEVDFWMASNVQAISPLVDSLMRLIERAKCVPGAEFDVELAIREALGNAVVHGNQENPIKKYTSGAVANPATKYPSS